MKEMSTRIKVKNLLSSLGVENKFTIHSVSFADLGRGSANVVIIKDWKPNLKANEIKVAINKHGLLVQFN